jgi:hypothetical protein
VKRAPASGLRLSISEAPRILWTVLPTGSGVLHFCKIEVGMVRLQVALLLMVVMGAAGFLIIISLNGCGGVAGNNSQPPPPGKINHVVIIFQENRTPDNLFHDPVLMSRGADIASSGKNSSG